MKKWLVIALAALLGLSQTACNTTRGVGEDVEAAGEGIQDLAEDAEDEIED